MVAIFTVLLAFPCGFFFRSRLAGNAAYVMAYLWAFTFQSVYLILGFLDGDSDTAFDKDKFPFDYGIVTGSILLAGLGLVAVGHRAGRGRRERQESARSSRTGTMASAASGNTAASANVAG